MLGGTQLTTRSKLAQLIAQVESGDNPHASVRDYAGNISSNAQYQQGAAFIHTWGDGAEGVDHLARHLLLIMHSATLGDYYCVYNHGSILPWPTYLSRFPLQAHNFMAKAAAAGYSHLTPLSPLLELV